MSIPQFINEVVFKTANIMLDVLFLWGGLLAFFSYPVYFFATNLKKYSKEQKSRELISQAIILFLLVSAIAIIWLLPDLILLIVRWRQGTLFIKPAIWQKWAWLLSTWRLLVAWAGFFLLAYVFGRRHGQGRWRQSGLGLGAILLLGWILNRWMGIFFVSVPLLVTYYASLHDLALVVVPASNPEDKEEQRKRTHAFISYTWGMQSPMVVVDDHAWKTYDPRIPGDITWKFSDFPLPLIKNLERPGLIWTRSHQVVSITGGVQFKRVDGPGLVFTGKMERPDQVFDLRLQLRTKEIEVISKDGVHFIARFFTAFRIDNEVWGKDLYNTLRSMNPLLRGADRLSHSQGSFHYSNLRVQAALNTTSTRTSTGNSLIFWDQWAANVVEDQTRKVISQKNLDEMWRPANDSKYANAMDIIAKEIKGNCETILRSAGILLVVARVVNFRFPQEEGAKEGDLDGISEQQIATWKSEWDRRRDAVLAEARAESERAQQEARAYAEAVLLNAIAEGLQKTHEINPHLPRYVIAMRFLSALQDYIHKQPEEGEDDEETKRKLGDLQKEFKTWQEQFFPE